MTKLSLHSRLAKARAYVDLLERRLEARQASKSARRNYHAIRLCAKLGLDRTRYRGADTPNAPSGQVESFYNGDYRTFVRDGEGNIVATLT